MELRGSLPRAWSRWPRSTMAHATRAVSPAGQAGLRLIRSSAGQAAGLDRRRAGRRDGRAGRRAAPAAEGRRSGAAASALTSGLALTASASSASVRSLCCKLCCFYGAGAEIRTRTPLRAAEFKSAASAVPPLRREARVAERQTNGLGRAGQPAGWTTGRRRLGITLESGANARPIASNRAIASGRIEYQIHVPRRRLRSIRLRAGRAGDATRSAG